MTRNSHPAPPPARGQAQRQLETLQKKVTEGQLALARRDELAYAMWQDGMSQAEIAARLDRADRAAGGDGITLAVTQKRLFRLRKRKVQTP